MGAPGPDDWRRQGQERYLQGMSFRWTAYRPPRPSWDHDHCEFCGAKFMQLPAEGILTEGFASEDGDRWICAPCFHDFADELALRTLPPHAPPDAGGHRAQ